MVCIPELLGIIAAVSSSCLSGVACACLFAILWRLPASHRTKLLTRQLMHLAAADVIYAVFEILASLADLAAMYRWQGYISIMDLMVYSHDNGVCNALQVGLWLARLGARNSYESVGMYSELKRRSSWIRSK